jgi:lipopolysaccharide export system protein LptA
MSGSSRLRAGLLAAASVVWLAAGALAQDGGVAGEADATDAASERRVITIDSSGGTQSGNLRYGPIRYEHPDPLGIVATVSTLTIRGPAAELSAPPDTLLARAKGERTARFEGGVQVQRGRLNASGPELVYQEATGLGVLTGGVNVAIAPDDPDGEPTRIDAASAEFDVDTDRSVSRGEVVLVSGNQRAEADRLDYAEDLDLGALTCDELCTIVRTSEDGDLVITAEEIRVLTQDERLWARGSVTVVDGDLVTTGDEVVYDDAEQLAEVTGSPARSVDEAAGVTLESDRILQDVQFDFVEAIDASQASDIDLDAFRFPEERGDPAP